MNNYPNEKKVNIIPTVAITRLNPPIRTTVRRVTKSVSEIRACLINRAIVEEILPDNSTLRLDFTNYDKNNRPTEKDKVLAKIEKIEQSKADSPKTEEQPVVVEEPQPVIEEPVKEEEVVKTEDIEVVPVTVEEQPAIEEVKTEEAAEPQQVQPQQQIIYNKKHKKH